MSRNTYLKFIGSKDGNFIQVEKMCRRLERFELVIGAFKVFSALVNGTRVHAASRALAEKAEL